MPIFYLNLQFPSELATIVNVLRSVDLSDNKIDVIPEGIGAFINLKHLNLSHNRIGKCVKLCVTEV